MKMRVKAKANNVSEKPEAEKGIRIFVYGTLKRLHYNHQLIDGPNAKGNVFLGACFLEGPYQMRNLGFFPGVQHLGDFTKKNRIYGEVYRVTEDTLKSLDILEGNGSFFTRSQVETPWKKAWMYMIPLSYVGKPVIEGGCWKPMSGEQAFITLGSKSQNAADYLAAASQLIT